MSGPISKRQAQDRLASVTAELAKAQARLGQRPADDTGELPEIKQLDGFDCRTGLPDGFRYLYCLVRGVISVLKLEAIAGRSIFLPGGPHGKDLNLTDEMRFGHYDPRFLDWLEPYLIPTEFGDVRSNWCCRRRSAPATRQNAAAGSSSRTASSG